MARAVLLFATRLDFHRESNALHYVYRSSSLLIHLTICIGGRGFYMSPSTIHNPKLEVELADVRLVENGGWT